jgi:hypothetical protein
VADGVMVTDATVHSTFNAAAQRVLGLSRNGARRQVAN